MSSLERQQVGNFYIEDAVSIQEVQDNIDSEEFKSKHYITIEKFFRNKESINLDSSNQNDNKSDLEKFLNGVKLQFDKEDGIYKIYNKNIFIGIGVIEDKKLKRDIVI